MVLRSKGGTNRFAKQIETFDLTDPTDRPDPAVLDNKKSNKSWSKLSKGTKQMFFFNFSVQLNHSDHWSKCPNK